MFLDIDGTLIDIASTPNDVVIPQNLSKILENVTLRLDGALAILTGRPIADVDILLAPLAPVAAGIHGAEIRFFPSGDIANKARPVNARIEQAVQALSFQHPSVLIERKQQSIALHYRQAPEVAAHLESALLQILKDSENDLTIARGKQVLELVPKHISKGSALEEIMGYSPFAEKQPIMIGDDISDQSAFAVARRLGGKGMKVAGEQFSRSESDFDGPSDVLAWLELLSRHLI